MSTPSTNAAKVGLIATVILGLATLAGAQAPTSGPALGSPNFTPTADHPVGWRGDWTGRFPGATPPTEWSRRVKGITTELKYQADKPGTGEPGKDARPLEYFTIKDWLVAGPFAVDDPAKDIDKDLVGGEESAQPAENAKAGDSTWKFLRADVATQSFHECNGGTASNSNVDFVYAFGKFNSDGGKTTVEGNFANKVAYAHTYIYSPADAAVRLQTPWVGTAAKCWVNGKAAVLDPKNSRAGRDIDLVKGWNRILIKISAANGLAKDGGGWRSRWMVAAYLTPVGPVSYETKNVAWMTRMTGRSMSQPIVVGDRIFIGSGISDLMCIDKKSGKILWMRSSSPYDALTPDERAAVPGMKDTIEPLVAKLNALNDELVTAINAAVSPTGLPSDQDAALDAKVKAKTQAERAVLDAFAKADKSRFPQLYLNEVASSNAVPVSDGQHVFWTCGGAQYVNFPFCVACFDLDGKRVWTRFDTSMKGGEHGNHHSPALAEGKLLYGCGATRIAYDAASGKEAWRYTETKDWTNGVRGPVVAKAGSTTVVLSGKTLHRVSDGTVIGPSNIGVIFTDQTPIVQDGVAYSYGVFQGHGKPPSFVAVRLGEGGKAQTLWAPDGKDVWMPVRHNTIAESYSIASPLCVDGLIYSVEMAGGLMVLDPANKQCLYRQWLDGYNRYDRFLYGVCASPTLGGQRIYITDDSGYTHVLQPGAQFKETAHNVLENIFTSGTGGNPCRQESFYTSPWFEGKSMYLRGEEYLYCISGE